MSFFPGDACPEAKGCAINGVCPPGKVCQDDPDSTIGFNCVNHPDPCSFHKDKCRKNVICEADSSKPDGYDCKGKN